MQRLSNPPYQVANLKYLIISKNVLDSQESALRKYTSYSISATLLVGDLVGGHYFHSYCCHFAHNEGLMEIRNSKQGCLDFQPGVQNSFRCLAAESLCLAKTSQKLHKIV